MKKLIVAVFFMGLFLPGLNINAEENSDTQLTVKKINKQIIPLSEDMPQEVIDVYTSGGWQLNEELNQLERDVAYEGEIIEVDGQKVKTDKNGEAVINVDKQDDVEISAENLLTNNKQTKEIELNSKEEETIIYENIDLSEIIEDMGEGDELTEGAEVDVDSDEADGEVQVGGLTNGVKPKHGAYVHCNRFNGFQGDGKYCNKSKHPVKATINFFQSDCDVALAKSTKCLKDYTKSPYCSTKNTSTAGKCSSIVKHSKYYHKHTGWFSPSK
ncbi:hypothetical protein [Bacillus haynesii]|uniref:hypothetical protein n=1 Tax=Bacillus haynesii TaxID=1925021 RepID=UPI00227EFECB|nr:hypothetical protein [Bacillus haynesii]MCY8539669.1 hypothetical protein [Bacillus haynesii]